MVLSLIKGAWWLAKTGALGYGGYKIVAEPDEAMEDLGKATQAVKDAGIDAVTGAIENGPKGAFEAVTDNINDGINNLQAGNEEAPENADELTQEEQNKSLVSALMTAAWYAVTGNVPKAMETLSEIDFSKMSLDGTVDSLTSIMPWALGGMASWSLMKGNVGTSVVLGALTFFGPNLVNMAKGMLSKQLGTDFASAGEDTGQSVEPAATKVSFAGIDEATADRHIHTGGGQLTQDGIGFHNVAMPVGPQTDVPGVMHDRVPGTPVHAKNDDPNIPLVEDDEHGHHLDA